ncbi:MAG TPA: hypothetical protein VKG38_18410 [Solirubrobacteraceae bacterium]|nr:hypothetical protein [Solirubrobacteraceae bacterium]
MSGALQLGGDTKAVLLADAGMFLLALLLGVWKYRQIATSESHAAHVYVDIAHRVALLYSFALLLVATFVALSGWSATVNLVAAGAMTLYFYASVAGYALHGWREDTENQFHKPMPGLHLYMATLIVAEIGGWVVLAGGFLDKQIL